MMKNIVIGVMTGLLFLGASTAWAVTEFFVDTTRSVNGDGSSQSPWRLRGNIDWPRVQQALLSDHVVIFFSSNRVWNDNQELKILATGNALFTLTLDGVSRNNISPASSAPLWQVNADLNQKAVLTNSGGTGGSIYLGNNTSYVTIRGFSLLKPTWSGINIGAGNPAINIDHIVIDNVLVDSPVNNHGIWMGYAEDGVHDIVVRDCMIKRTPLEAIYMGHYSYLKDTITGVIVENNTLIDTGLGGEGDIDIKPGVFGAIIRNNTVSRTSADIPGANCGIVIAADQVQVYGNALFNAKQKASNDWGHGIYINADGDGAGNGHPIHGALIYNNIIYGNDRAGIKLTANSKTAGADLTGVRIYNNSILNNGTMGLQISASNGRSVQVDDLRNNILAHNAVNDVYFYAPPGSAAGIARADHNLYYRTSGEAWSANGVAKTWDQWQALGLDAHGVQGQDPLLVDAVHNVFYPLKSSSLINAGDDLSAVFTQDKDGVMRPQGKAWDIGAYQFPVSTQETPDNGILPERRIDWTRNAGLNFSIPNWPKGKDAKADYGAVGDGVTDDTAAIQSCITNTPLHSYCYVPPGTYRITSVALANLSVGFRVLKGAGVDQTILMADPGAGNILYTYSYGPSQDLNVISGAVKGSTRVMVDTTTANFAQYRAGDMILLDQDNGDTDENTPSYMGRTIGQRNIVIAKGSNYLDLQSPLNYNYNYAFNVRISRDWAVHPTQVGVEDLTVDRLPSVAGSGNNIVLGTCVNCWVKNVKSKNVWNWHVNLLASYGSVVRDSWFEQTWQYNCGGNACYGVSNFSKTSDSFIENNVFIRLRHSMVTEYGGTGNIFGYNYSREPINEHGLTTDYLMGDLLNHGGQPHMNLYEGNTAATIKNDTVLGSGRMNMFFRNNIEVKSIPSVYVAMFGIDDEASNLFENYVGNILGSSGKMTQLYRVGCNQDACSGNLGSVQIPDLRVTQTMLSHGNYNFLTHGMIWDPGGSSHALPDSLYLSSKPLWFGDVSWPPMGPDVAGLFNKIPAQVCYEQGKMPGCLLNNGAFSGDVSGDGRITMFDAALVLKYTVGGVLTTAQQAQADINGDTAIDTADAAAIARKAVGF